jgi:hypothetical protein
MKSFLRRKQAQAIAALVMAIAVLAMVVGLGLSTGIAEAAAQKVPLTKTNADCPGYSTQPEGVPTYGFAIINKTGSGKLIANVVLVGAMPNATYNIRLIQLPSGAPGGSEECTMVDGTLTTDAQGNGDANIQEPVLTNPNTTGAWVDLNNQANFNEFFTTRVVPFS